MPELQTLMTGISFGESPRWHDDRLWFSDWGTQEIIALDLEGNSEVIVRLPSFPFCIDWLPDGRLLIVSAPGRRRTHIHVRRAGSFLEQFALLFRDYLRAHAEDARRYAKVKHHLAEAYRHDRHGYTDAKIPHVWEIMARADRWSQEVGWEPGLTDA